MRLYETPGVYHERADADAGGVSALRTDIAGFVGIAARGPLQLAVPVQSYRQFEAWFGDTVDQGYLAYCAQAFFENGGRRMWVVRTASPAAATASLTLADAAGVPVWRIEASSPGTWGNALALRVVEVRRVQVRAAVDAASPERLRVEGVAGFEAHALVELSQAGSPGRRAVVRAVDAAARTLVLDRPLAGFAPDAPLRAETVAWRIDVHEAGRRVALGEDLTIVPAHPRYGPAVLRQPWQQIDRAAPERAPAAASSEMALRYFRVGLNRSASPPPAIVVRELRDAPARAALQAPAADPAQPLLPLQGGADGLAALSVRDFVGEPGWAQASDDVAADGRRGLAALDPVEEIGLVAVPDIHIRSREPAPHRMPPPCVADPCLPGAPAQPPAVLRAPGDRPPRFGLDAIFLVQAAQVEHCERHRDRVALLDAPYETCAAPGYAVPGLRAWRQRFDSAYAALYAPWLAVVDPLRARPGARGSMLREVPPCGHVAGLAAATDLRRGVHAAPANVPLRWAQRATLDLDDERHGILNTLGVNVVRAQAGRGLRVLGARTLSSDRDWRFLNVRRLMSMIEKAIDVSIQWAVFEPNDWRTRAKLALVVGSFLQELWSRGALVGSAPEQAYFVRCDETNNPPDARARGLLLVEVGIAPTVPFEFIVLRIGRDANGFAIHEREPLQAAA